MRIPIERLPIKVYPDAKRVIARFFFNGDDRAKQVIRQVMEIEEDQVFGLVSPLLQEYSKRHRNITRLLDKHCVKLNRLKLFEAAGVDFETVSSNRRLLIGSYFTHEYSIESAAFFNPSLVDDPDQSDLEQGEKRLIMSMRAVGEGHVSSIVFRRVLIDKYNNISVLPVGNHIDQAEVIRDVEYDKKSFLKRATSFGIDAEILGEVDKNLSDDFTYPEMRKLVRSKQKQEQDDAKKLEYERVLWWADGFYQLVFSLDTDISDRVIFPFSDMEKNGIEDARFVKFTDDDGQVMYYATYTAYDGVTIQPKLLETRDFYEFKMRPLYGEGAQNKNLALFPRKINGQYVMLARIDGCNNYIMMSDKLTSWKKPMLLQGPKYPWEFIQIGNCGSPIETEKGWLVITHAVGPMRRYCLSAMLLDLNDPTIEIGRLKEPLLVPNPDEREGYVPNVVYSCGAIVNNGKVIIPYGLSDYSSAFATVELDALLEKLISDGK